MNARCINLKQKTGSKQTGGFGFSDNFFDFSNEREEKDGMSTVCKTFFPKFKEILMIVDSAFYRYHCCCRLISYPGSCFVEEDSTGEKWRKGEKASLVSGSDQIGRTIQ
jgi:hypothetical protein